MASECHFLHTRLNLQGHVNELHKTHGDFHITNISFLVADITISCKVCLIQEEKKFIYLLLPGTEPNVGPWFFTLLVHNAHLRQYYLQHSCHDFSHNVHCAAVLNMNTHCSNKSFSYMHWNYPRCMCVDLRIWISSINSISIKMISEQNCRGVLWNHTKNSSVQYELLYIAILSIPSRFSSQG